MNHRWHRRAWRDGSIGAVAAGGVGAAGGEKQKGRAAGAGGEAKWGNQREGTHRGKGRKEDGGCNSTGLCEGTPAAAESDGEKAVRGSGAEWRGFAFRVGWEAAPLRSEGV
mgnify:CR=1 FL=1